MRLNGALYSGVMAFLDGVDAARARDTGTQSPPPSRSAPSGTGGGATGTGFAVTPDGMILTNNHVAGECRSLTVDGAPAALIAADADLDLALVQMTGATGLSSAAFSPRPAALNADVTVAGYPLAGLLGGLNITRGSVTGMKGLGGDMRQMQISAPVQPGNSGGPVVDAEGHVIGVVVSKLDAQFIQNEIGDIPQNVNFAIRGEIAKLFLSQNGVAPQIGATGSPPPPPRGTGPPSGRDHASGDLQLSASQPARAAAMRTISASRQA
ncbi:S1 family peptidase [Phaeovulum vinaykumarii]|uniref:Serine protease n=2 Tax=Phaeovulum vinaykumarii TaxID=407234 RepID=A0A1N7KUX6_9RHOB|nr:serine protease [Phaeovulum vinaykumarii]SIS65347.1 Trypsin-like peptidase domain-containing protein [Phaeovulum vinaykumarii]SOC01314.1 trypsin-like peptidase [Phaeovulum vinaykumarii]